MESKIHYLCTLFILILRTAFSHAGTTSSYTRSTDSTVDMPAVCFPPPKGYNTPEQVHITQGDYQGRGVIISWVTPKRRKPNVVKYWKASDPSDFDKAHSSITHYSYDYGHYKSGFIHHATIKELQYDTKYIYELGSADAIRQFSFTTPEPGPDVAYTFGIIGDLGQTFASNSTLRHYMANGKGQTVLYVGDLSYADDFPRHDQRKWDTWGRFVETSAAYQPWIWTAGNHELDLAPQIRENRPFKPYLHRFRVPNRESGSTSRLWYSIKRGPTYIIVLSSYSAFTKYTPQYNWFEAELKKVDRHETPWLILLMHAPMYNSDKYHYMEGESMRVIFEPWIVKAKFDLVLAGHVHAYERSERISNIRYNITNGLSTPIKDQSAPVYITIGDGGNIEGRANNFIEPQPSYSAYREASFGHGILEIKNRTHAYYSWHRNQDYEAVASDSTWFYNRYWYPMDESV